MPLTIDEEIYKWWHLIENFFCKRKEFKRIALRADKTEQSYAAMIQIAPPLSFKLDESQQALELCPLVFLRRVVDHPRQGQAFAANCLQQRAG